MLTGMAELLAVRHEPQSDLEVAELVHGGLTVRSLRHVLAELERDFPRMRLYQVLGNPRTLQRMVKERANKPLALETADRLVRLVRLVARATEAIGDGAKARAWLQRPNRALGGRAPLDLLDSDPGARAVERVLGRIEHGVYS